MQPQQQFSQFLQANRVRITQILLLIALVGGISFGLYKWYDATHLRLITTEPSSKSEASEYTWVRFRFNKPLRADANKVTISPQVEGKVEVQGKDVVFRPTGSFNMNTEYTAKLAEVTTADGKYKHKEATVKFKITLEGQIPKERYEEVVKTVDVADAQQPRFDGTEAFLDDGLSATQTESLRNELRLFQPKAKEFIIDIASIEPEGVNDEGTFFIDFNIKIDGKDYKARMDYTELDTVKLYLSDEQGSEVFNSDKAREQAGQQQEQQQPQQ